MLSKIAFSIIALISTLTLSSGQTSFAADNLSLLQRIDAVGEVLIQLDELADDCLQSEQPQSTSETSQPSLLTDDDVSPCTAFIEAIDGEILASYLQHCSALKSWRDDYVTSTIAADIEPGRSEENLQLMVGIEYSCGENALLQRSQFITQAFALANQRELLLQSPNTRVSSQLREIELENRLSADRRALLRDVQLEHQRALQQTQEQFMRLENELIRQQINRPR